MLHNFIDTRVTSIYDGAEDDDGEPIKFIF